MRLASRFDWHSDDLESQTRYLALWGAFPDALHGLRPYINM
jgi:hypothetical protein